jgi:adenine-specific DNA-methyltransferase
MSKNIDPPYNTGARDWKYNNDYVDSSDSYRHSKWLSMMQKRLKIAKRILNPNNSVLIVTIDEKEYLHLGCLLEEMFPEANIQMITDVTNPKGVSRGSLFSRAEEYIYFVFVGSASINLGSTDMLRSNEQKSSDIRWASLQRSGSNSRRFERPNLFYPIFFDKETDKFVTVGETMSLNEDRKKVVVPDGLRVAFPLGRNDDERTWQLQQETFMSLFEKGYVKFGNWQSNEKRTISYLSSGLIKQIENGELQIKSYDEDGTVVLDGDSKVKPLSVWNKSSHSASDQGSSLISNILSGKRFTFPKSLYATHDALWFFVAEKPNALIVDFFAGSGTTLHAVNLLNAEDGGHRRCIMVTNNEVSADEAKALTERGFQPGDPEWEKLGIARYVTWPRTVCSIEGHDVNGAPLKGDYLVSDTDGNPIPMSQGFKANAAYFKLGFLDKNDVALGRQFKEILPLLWLKAGAVGKRPEYDGELPDMLILPENRLAILINESGYMSFAEQLNEHPEIDSVFIVTDSERAYREMISGLKVTNTYQLYRSYLDNFRINARR